MHNPTTKNRGRAMRVTLPCEWGRHCSTVAASPKHGTARCLSSPKTTPFMEWGGETGCVHRGVAQARHCKSPEPPPPPPLRRTKHSCNGGGGDRGCSPWCCPAGTALQNTNPPSPPPPSEEPNICVMGGGRGCSLWGRSSRHLTSPIPP